MSETLKEKISSWLDEQGYPLEMETASVAKSLGFDVSQSDYYIDPEGDEAREIDLVVSSNNYAGNYNKSYNLFIECKSNKKSKPWLVFSNINELMDDATSIEEHVSKMHKYSSFIASEYAEKLLLKTAGNNNFNNIYPRLGVEPMLGHGVTQAFGTTSDIPFKAMMSATKAAMSHIKRFGIPMLSVPCTIAIPVVVIDSPLFTVSYNSESEEFEIEQVPKVEILWKHLVAGKSRNGIFIVERNNLNEFLTECKKSSDWWLNIDDSQLEEIHNEITGRK